MFHSRLGKQSQKSYFPVIDITVSYILLEENLLEPTAKYIKKWDTNRHEETQKQNNWKFKIVSNNYQSVCIFELHANTIHLNTALN